MGGVFVLWLIVRFVYYTGTDLKMKQRMISESEATRLEDRRREVEELLVSQNAWLRVVSQIVADALGHPVHIDAQVPPRVAGRPVPYFTVLDEEGTRYVLTTDPKAMQRVGLLGKAHRPLRLSNSVEPGLVWNHLAERHIRGTGDTIPAVPRDAEWSLVVVQAA